MLSLETEEEYDDFIADNPGKLLVIDFYADWCGPCRLMGPKYVRMEPEYPECILAKVNIDDNPEASERAQIAVMPTFQFFKDGEQVAELNGGNEAQLRELIEQHK